jgi:iron-sulfur cluster repair protein YtfE (RIC family)
MRSPVEIWLNEHRDLISRADELVEMLAPDDIQLKLIDPDEKALRANLADLLDKLTSDATGHFRKEEELLVPLINKHLDTSTPEMKEALGCLTREHAQMHMFVERIKELLPLLRSDDPFDSHNAAELLRVAYGVQSILRHHTSKEEREVYPLVKKLPMKAVHEIITSLDPSDDIPLDHLIRPIGPRDGNGQLYAEDGEAPEN